MTTLLPLELARDAVAAQFAYDEHPVPTVANPRAGDPVARAHRVPGTRARRTRTRVAGVLHRAADAVAPAECSPVR